MPFAHTNGCDEESTPRLHLTESPNDGSGQVDTQRKMAFEPQG